MCDNIAVNYFFILVLTFFLCEVGDFILTYESPDQKYYTIRLKLPCSICRGVLLWPSDPPHIKRFTTLYNYTIEIKTISKNSGSSTVLIISVFP